MLDLVQSALSLVRPTTSVPQSYLQHNQYLSTSKYAAAYVCWTALVCMHFCSSITSLPEGGQAVTE